MNTTMEALDILWKGMLSIFIVVLVIFLFIKVMNIIDTNQKLKKEKNTEKDNKF
jgi:large-conductance mechanosensitive channel